MILEIVCNHRCSCCSSAYVSVHRLYRLHVNENVGMRKEKETLALSCEAILDQRKCLTVVVVLTLSRALIYHII